MRTLSALLLLVLSGLSACGADAEPELPDVADAMGAALFHVATVDNTFGGQMSFAAYLVQERTDPHAGGDFDQFGSRPLNNQEVAAITAALAGLGEVRWVAGPDDFWGPEDEPRVPGSVLLGVGDAAVDGDAILVPVSLLCGSTCGTWRTYRVELVDGAARVTGSEGPIVIS